MSESIQISAGIATGYGLDDRMVGVRFPAGAGNFFLRHCIQTSSGVHPASYPMGTRGSFPGGGGGSGRGVNLTSHLNLVPTLKLYLHSPSTTSWRGA
jgi:hypothetical protein